MKLAVAFFILLIFTLIAHPQTRSRTRPPSTVPAPKVPDLKSADLATFDYSDLIDIGTLNLYEVETSKKQIFRQRDGTIKIWVTQTVRPSKMPEIIKEIKADRMKTFEASRFHHSKSLYRLKCSERLIKATVEWVYDLQGEVLQVINWNESWNDVVPDSIGERIFNAACAHR